MPAPGRYVRQEQLTQIGPLGQRRLRAQGVLVVGCGGLGGLAAELLVRAGLGRVRVIDPDRVDLPNLHRQIFFEEADALDARGKAGVAGERLKRVNTEVEIEALAVRLDASNALDLLDGVELVVDATDNPETRYLLNDACLERGIPWVYGGAVGTSGMTAVLCLPGGPCLRCLFPEPPPESLRPTCASEGVLNSLPALVASLQVSQALRVLLGDPPPAELWVCDAWQGSVRRVQAPAREDCPACRDGRRDFLQGEAR